MAYSVKELFYTLQGEGIQSGRPAVFCRFSGCNLWSGLEKDRETAKCWFCDTDFVGTDGPGGGKFESAASLAEAISETWPKEVSRSEAFLVFTGGEPLLQLDEELVKAIKDKGFKIAIETNGTIKAPAGIDWICVSPKPNSELVQKSGNELKLVYPQTVSPESVADFNFDHFLLSPLYSDSKSELEKNTAAAAEYCRLNPKWRLTMQAHKVWGIA